MIASVNVVLKQTNSYPFSYERHNIYFTYNTIKMCFSFLRISLELSAIAINSCMIFTLQVRLKLAQSYRFHLNIHEKNTVILTSAQTQANWRRQLSKYKRPFQRLNQIMRSAHSLRREPFAFDKAAIIN